LTEQREAEPTNAKRSLRGLLTVDFCFSQVERERWND